MRSKVNKCRPCNGRTLSFSILSFMLFFVAIAGILPNVDTSEKNIVFLFIIIFFMLHIIFVFYSLLKLNSLIFFDENKIFQQQFGKIINIKYDEITDVKLSFAFYIRAPYAIIIYENNKRIMFEVTSKAFDEFMKNCSNFDVKNTIEILLKEKGIYLN